MKRIYTALFLLLGCTMLFAQRPNNAYRLPQTPDMPEWATKLYRDDVEINVFELDEAFEIWEENYEAHEKAERIEWVDRGEEPTFEENAWEEYYERWRHAVAPYVQQDGSLDFIAGPVPPKVTKPGTAENLTANWSLLGPNITYWAKNDNTAQPIAPWHANVYSIDVAPSDPNVLYYGTETGAVGKTTDKGLNWTPIGLTNTAFRSGASALAIHPTDPNTVYLGNATGVHKTTNGGLNWTQELTVSSYNTNDIKIKPDAPEEVLAAGSSLRRRTAGPTWTTLISRTTYDVSFKPDDPSIAYALIGNVAGTLCEFYKSIDGGATFSVRSTGWVAPISDGGGRMTVTSANANRIYVALLTSSGPRILRSDDAGETWTITASGGTTALAMDDGQGYYDLSISASQSDANQVIVGTTTAYKSIDGGVNYTVLGGYSGPFGIHPDIQEMKTVGGDSWIATDGGINLSTDFWTSTSNFSSRINGLTGTHFWAFDMGWNEDAIVGGRYHNGNTAWHENYPAGTYLRMGGGEQPTGYINPGNSRMAYFSDLSGIGRLLPVAINQNYGNFTVTKSPNENYTSMEWSEQEWDPRYYYHYYLGKDNILWKTTNNGATFTALFTHSDATAKVMHIEVGRTDPNTIYCTVQRTSSGELWKSTDGGTSWTQCANPVGPTALQRKISNVSLSGTDANVLWWCFRSGPNGNKIFKSIDGGTTWTNLTTATLNGVSLADMVHQLGTDGGIYLNGDFGVVYYRNNTMSDWMTYNTGLPAHLSSESSRIKIQYKKEKLRLASINGVWETDLFENSATLAQPMVDNISPSCSRDTLQLESYSVVNGNATYQWSISPTPQWISNANVRNPRIVLGGTAGPFAATLTVTDDNGATNKTISNFIDNLPAGNLCSPDTIPGKSLVLDGSGDYALPSANLNLNSNRVTMTAWIKRQGPQTDFAGILYARGGTTSAGLSITSTNQLRYTWDDAAGSYNFNTGFVVPDSIWTHVALVITPLNAKVYMNGKVATRTAAHPAEAFDTPLKLGYDNGSRYFKGQIDEVTVWDRSLTQDSIRELMHLTLTPLDEPDLVAYYQFNEPSGAANDKVASRHAALVGDATRQVSTGPFGKGFSKRITVTTAGFYVFDPAELTLDFPTSGPNGELCVTRINQAPDQVPNGNSSIGRGYWIVNNYGTVPTFAQLTALFFEDYADIPVTATASDFQLYKRGSFADGNTWGTAIDVADGVSPGVHGAVLFNAGNNVTSFSQFVITSAVPLPVALLSFDARLQGKNTAALHWITTSEKNNKGFEVEWMEGANGTFKASGFVESKGDNTGKNDYSFEIKDLSAGEHYFRLKQIDLDGAVAYSSVQSVTVGRTFSANISPNPVRNELILDIFQEQTAAISIALVNALGQTTELRALDEVAKGHTSWRFDVSGLPAGLYYCVCKTENGLEKTVRVVKQ